jgi:hypothetical protein
MFDAPRGGGVLLCYHHAAREYYSSNRLSCMTRDAPRKKIRKTRAFDSMDSVPHKAISLGSYKQLNV